MKRMILLVALAVASPAWAQAPTQKEAAKPAPAAKPAAAAKKSVAKKSRRSQDARHCLQRGDNNAIIKCAEEFL
jgi:hypothetical protein